jgi:hypothetical protein
VQLNDSAQTQNIFRFKIFSVLYGKELNWSNNMCLDYHNEVKISLEILIFYSFDKKVLNFSGFDPGSFRSKVACLTPRP